MLLWCDVVCVTLLCVLSKCGVVWPYVALCAVEVWCGLCYVALCAVAVWCGLCYAASCAVEVWCGLCYVALCAVALCSPVWCTVMGQCNVVVYGIVKLCGVHSAVYIIVWCCAVRCRGVLHCEAMWCA